MRIISGKYRGMRLAAFAGGDIRPTADRVKESLFSVLGRRVEGARVLDLFCGSGNLGLECLSRGAASVQFNDLSRGSLAVLERNLARLKGGERFLVTALDFRLCLARAEGEFDLIFLDPPYRTEYGAEGLKLLAERRLLAAGGVAVYEHDGVRKDEIDGLAQTDMRRYGRTSLSFFERREQE